MGRESGVEGEQDCSLIEFELAKHFRDDDWLHQCSLTEIFYTELYYCFRKFAPRLIFFIAVISVIEEYVYSVFFIYIWSEWLD